MTSPFEVLSKINCNEHTEKKNGLTYLAWAWAWSELKKLYPASFYTIYENKDGLFYHTDGKTCWVKTGVTLVDDGYSLEHIEYLPVMDFKNRSIAVDGVTSFDVNKAIQRSLTKAVARHGLGLYIYAGEDLPEEDKEEGKAPQKPPKAEESSIICSSCKKPIPAETLIDGKMYPAAAVAKASTKQYGVPMCYSCKRKADMADAKRESA